MIKIASCLLGLLFSGGAVLAAGTILAPRRSETAAGSDPAAPPRLPGPRAKPLLPPGSEHGPAMTAKSATR
jgi:hypothetical protein